jgi:DNA repair exonuclease SbcCD ATPase subunit
MNDEFAAQLEKVLWWINKGFSASGLKAFVFNAMLTQLNLYVERYAERLGVRVKFSVDLSKASRPFVTTCYKNEVEVEYGELSGGEKQRVDVALAFAMHDLVSHTALVNILIMDEVFEGLDGDGVETVYDLIRLKAGDGKAVYIVSHSNLLDSQYTKHIGIDYDTEYKTSRII